MVNIEIDGKKIQAREGAMVIEAADDAGIYIPRFCYHKKLSIAANCRMCLVEVEKVAKALPACATPVTDGMKVFTRSGKARAAQKSVMEFLLINHPLDCPICDQGGECELQDIAMGYGNDVSQFAEGKRVVPNKDFGPLIAGDMTRCIHCTRCVRFGSEIAGIRELGATGRGEHMEIGTYVQLGLSSELSGNVIDLCPVGALTAKPSRFTARAWEMVQRDSIAPHDCMGSNIHVHVWRDQAVRVVPRENEEINETWLSDRDRFSYEGLNSADRLQVPMIKVDGQWQTSDWETALLRVVEGIKQFASTEVGAIASPSSTLEELYLLQKLMRGVGCNNIDHRLMQTDFSDQDQAPAYPGLGQSIQQLEDSDAVLLIGSDVRHDQPIAAHRLRKATARGASILCVNPRDYDFHMPVQAKCISDPAQMATDLAAIAKALLALTGGEAPQGFADLAAAVTVNDAHNTIAATLHKAANAALLLGPIAQGHAGAASIRSLSSLIAKLSGATLGYLTDGANAAGACLAGALPNRSAAGEAAGSAGLDLNAMLGANLQAYLLLGVEPELDCLQSAQAMEAMRNARFVVSMNAFVSDAMREYCDVLLPVTPFSETSGTFVNAEGRWQSFEGVVKPLGEARPAWKVLRVLGNLFDVDGFDYVTSAEIKTEVEALCKSVEAQNLGAWHCPATLTAPAGELIGLLNRKAYAGDGLVRRAASLQKVDSMTSAGASADVAASV